MSTVKFIAGLLLLFISAIVLLHTSPVSAHSKAEKLWKRLAPHKDDVVDPALVHDLENENEEDDSVQDAIKQLLLRTKTSKPKVAKKRGVLDRALVDPFEEEEEEEFNKRREAKLRRKKQKLNKFTETTSHQISNPTSSPEIDEHHESMIDAEIMKEESASEESEEEKANNANALKEALRSFAENFHLE